MLYGNTDDIEYLGSVAVGIKYYEPWDEWIHKTCSYTTCSGGKVKTCVTHTYDCSYREYHEPEWVVVDQSGNERNINKEHYEILKKRWGTKSEFINMDRSYYTIDGDAYYNSWDFKPKTTQGISSEKHYENKTLGAASTIFKFKDLTYDEVKAKGLYDYPEIKDNLLQPTILGASFQDSIKRKYAYLNGVLGPKKQVRLYILYFWDKPRSIMYDQRSYWKGGNKNEIVFCVGVDKKTKSVQWVDSFSWSRNPVAEIKIKTWYASHKDFNIDKLFPVAYDAIDKGWYRRNFKDFNYLEIELTRNQIIWLWILLMIINVGVGVWVVMNGIDNE